MDPDPDRRPSLQLYQFVNNVWQPCDLVEEAAKDAAGAARPAAGGAKAAVAVEPWHPQGQCQAPVRVEGLS